MSIIKSTRNKPKRRHKNHVHELKELLIRHHKKQLSKINELNNQLKTIMASVAELTQQAIDLKQDINDLQKSVDNVQSAIGTAIADFEKQIADLKAIIAAGGTITPEQLQPIADALGEAKTALAAAKTDLEGTATS